MGWTAGSKGLARHNNKGPDQGMQANEGTLFIIDDDDDCRQSLAWFLSKSGYEVEAFAEPQELLDRMKIRLPDCLIIDILLGGVSGLRLAGEIGSRFAEVPILLVTGMPRLMDAVDSVKVLGAVDYLQKPVDPVRMLHSVGAAVATRTVRKVAADNISSLTQREREVFGLLTRGFSNKMIAMELNISSKTVENHRASVLTKTKAANIAHLMAMKEKLSA
jgi:FixJ family two-component response regulator